MPPPIIRRAGQLTRGLRLFVLLMATGGAITFVHDYTYRRVDVGGLGDYEFDGLITHAGTDMLILTFVIATAATLYARSRN